MNVPQTFRIENIIELTISQDLTEEMCTTWRNLNKLFQTNSFLPFSFGNNSQAVGVRVRSFWEKTGKVCNQSLCALIATFWKVGQVVFVRLKAVSPPLNPPPSNGETGRGQAKQNVSMQYKETTQLAPNCWRCLCQELEPCSVSTRMRSQRPND